MAECLVFTRNQQRLGVRAPQNLASTNSSICHTPILGQFTSEVRRVSFLRARSLYSPPLIEGLSSGDTRIPASYFRLYQFIESTVY